MKRHADASVTREDYIIQERLTCRSLDSIGREVGLTRERVRQIIRDAEVEEDTRVRLQSVDASPIAKPRPPRVKFFVGTVQGWLSLVGCQYCSYGKHVHPIDDFNGRICRPCNTQRCADYTKKNRKKINAWRKIYNETNPEVQRRANANWYAKKRRTK